MNASGPITQFPSEGLRKAKRFITSHNEEGKGVFIQEDHGDFETVMGDGQAVRLDLFTTEKFPIDMNDEKDVKWSSSVRAGLYIPNGIVFRLIDFAPSVESDFHRVPALAFGIVIEGVFELVLDGGEARRMYPGDTFIQRGTFHVVRNPLSDKSCRMVFALLDAEPLIVNGTAVKTDMGFHSKEYHEK